MGIFDEFNRLSFWLGFLSACLIWFLGLKLRDYWAPLKDYLTEKINLLKIKQSVNIDDTLRLEILKSAQNYHLARTLFSLDEVLIIPRLMAPAKWVDPSTPALIESAQPQILPSLPLVPQFSAQYNNETIAIPSALRSGINLAITGHPGSGKSIALAYLASLFARKDPILGPLSDFFPIYLNFNDITDFEPANNPVALIIKNLTWKTSGGMRTKLQTLVQKSIHDQKAILLLDGLDEVSYPKYLQGIEFLASIIKSLPKLRVVTTASLDRAGGLQPLGIEPLPIAGWTRTEISMFIERWSRAWSNFASHNRKDDGGGFELDGLIVKGWQSNEIDFYSPIEWTTRLWATFNRDLPGTRGIDAIAAYCRRLKYYGIDLGRLSQFAGNLFVNQQDSISFVELDNFFSEIIIPTPTPLSDISFEPGNLTQNEVTFQAPPEVTKKTDTRTVGEQVIETLTDYGLLREIPNERFSLNSPTIWGYLASLQAVDVDITEFEIHPWSTWCEHLHYSLVGNKSEWVKQWLLDDQEPFCLRTVLAALWMHDLPPKDLSRTLILRNVVQRVQSDDTPYQTRLSLLAASSMSNDTSMLQLIRQFATSDDPAVRQISTLCSGMLRDGKAFNNLVKALSDPELFVRWSGCFALAALESPDGQNAVQTILDRSDEPLRLATAEALASRPPWGHTVLKNAELSADIITRRALIFGLLHVREPWVINMLERLAAEDSQWVVRNFASQGLEHLQNLKHHNRLLVNPADSPWLIAYAARHGRGVSRGDSLIPTLVQVLNSGTTEEQTGAIQLLGRYADKVATDSIKAALHSPEYSIRAAAYNALWQTTYINQPVNNKYS